MLWSMNGPPKMEAPDTCMHTITSAEGSGVEGVEGNATMLAASARGEQIPMGPCSAAIAAPCQGTARAPPGCDHATKPPRSAGDVWPVACRMTGLDGFAGAAAVGVPPAESARSALKGAAGGTSAITAAVDVGGIKVVASIDLATTKAKSTIPKYDLAVGEDQDRAARRNGAIDAIIAAGVQTWEADLNAGQVNRHAGHLDSAAKATLAAAARRGDGWQAPEASDAAPRSRVPRSALPARTLSTNHKSARVILLLR